MSKVLIIAEAGVNHNGEITKAYELIDAAAAAGADIVKFQTFRAENLVTIDADKADYQKDLTPISESQYDMLKKLELDRQSHLELKNYCDTRSIQFLSTPFDKESLDLVCEVKVPLIKISSGEITNKPMLRKIGEVGKPIIMSTGMSTLSEIAEALEILTMAGAQKENITLLHCNSEYPTPVKDVNLRAMLSIKNAFNVKVGYSDHTLGIEIPIAAIALGATVIEKHFTLNRSLPGPDHKASLEPNELEAMVKAIHNVEDALGNGIKKPSVSEIKNINIVRKSIVASKFIEKGEEFSNDNLTTKRPGTGISPLEWDKLIGIKANKKYRKNEFIDYNI